MHLDKTKYFLKKFFKLKKSCQFLHSLSFLFFFLNLQFFKLPQSMASSASMKQWSLTGEKWSSIAMLLLQMYPTGKDAKILSPLFIDQSPKNVNNKTI
jgi:hypothetical protein